MPQTVYRCDRCGSIYGTMNEARTCELKDEDAWRTIHKIAGKNKDFIKQAMDDQKKRLGEDKALVPDVEALEFVTTAVAKADKDKRSEAIENVRGTKKTKAAT